MLTIVSGGTGFYTIAVCDGATAVEQTAAAELQTYIQKASGVTLAIVAESAAQDKSFMVGPTAFALSNGVEPTGEEQWAIKCVGNKIIVTGGRPRGTLYAAFHLLEEEIGVRWWNPWEEHVPSKPTLTFNDALDKTGSPSFPYRDIYDGLYDTGANFTGSQPSSLFYARNRLNGHFSFAPAAYGGTIAYGFPYHAHTFHLYFRPEQYFDAHPEYYSVVSGVRTRNGQLDLTNADVKALMKQKVRDSIAASYANADAKGLPRPSMFSVTANDWRGFCEEPSCQSVINSKGSSGYLLEFVNEIAADIATSYPEVILDTFAYWFYIDPPSSVAPSSNVQIRYANIDLDLLHSIGHSNNAPVRSKLQSWKAISDRVIFWDYAVNYYPNPPIPSQYDAKADSEYLLAQGLTGALIEHEGTVTTDMWDMKVWMEAKFLENPGLDLETVMNDFTAKYYGLAASYVNNYLYQSRLLADSTNNFVTFGTSFEKYDYFTLDYVNWCETNFDQAEAAVSGDSIRLRRLRHCRASLDRLILFRWNALKNEAVSRGVAMTFSRKKSAARYVNTMKEQKALRSLAAGSLIQPWNDKAVDDEIRQMVIPADLAEVPYRCMIDVTADRFRLWTANGGLTQIEDDRSLIGQCTKVTLSGFDTQANANLHKPGVTIGLYNPVNGNRTIRTLEIPDITPNAYKLYYCGTAKLYESDYLYIFRSNNVQVDMANLISGQSDQLYDIYVSMNFEGAVYGGSSSNLDAVYIDRIILVGKGVLPSELNGVSYAAMTDFSPESFRLWTAGGGLARIEEGHALTRRCAKVTLNQFATETDRAMHLVTPSFPMLIGVYSPANGARVIKQIFPADIALNVYKVYKMENLLLGAGDYLYLFSSWVIQCDIFKAFRADPNQRYDIYVSIKFEGPAFGGDLSREDAVYVDRIVVVRR